MPLANKFPPKFSQNILYPAVYNLDEMDMPQSDYPLGTYFDVHFPLYGINAMPTLTYGKHKFDINIKAIAQEYNIQGYPTGESLPKLKNGSRILFEFKDAPDVNGKRRVIYSDYTPIIKTDGFTNYIWIKKDPLRTYDDINPGMGQLTIVARVQNTNPNWKSKYNIRSTLPVYIDLHDGDNTPWDNRSPIVFQANTSSLGSGSGLIMNEVITNQEANIDICNIQISASRLRTYSGEIFNIRTYMKISGSSDPQWEFLADHPLSSSNYEDDIYTDFGQGINTLSEKWSHIIPSELVPKNPPDGTKVKFKLEFRNPDNDIAKDYYTNSNVHPDYILQYPNLPDTEYRNGWLNFEGGTHLIPMSAVNPNASDDTLAAETGAGQFSFNPDFNSSVESNGGQTFKSNGDLEPSTFNPGGGGGGNCEQSQFGCGGDKPTP
tara:strand:- start:333 stop:1634 length:1302 start_codon:yes stop_codon:yes gene_type:complete